MLGLITEHKFRVYNAGSCNHRNVRSQTGTFYRDGRLLGFQISLPYTALCSICICHVTTLTSSVQACVATRTEHMQLMHGLGNS